MARPGPYQYQALIALAHADSPTWEETRWPDIVQIYDRLLALSPSPVVRLNRAIAVSHVAGPERALAEVDALEDDLDRYHLFHATRAELLRELGRDGGRARGRSTSARPDGEPGGAHVAAAPALVGWGNVESRTGRSSF